MKRMTTRLAVTLLAGLPILAVGCVPQDRYDSLLSANRSLEEQLHQLETERDSARSDLDRVRDRFARASMDYNELQSEKSRLQSEVDRMAREYDQLLTRVSELDFGPLPVEVESALEDLARAYPDLLTFDARRGLIRFASDFTFDLGSASLRSDAQDSLRRMAEILNTDAARQFEARIIGHTDNVPIRRAETRQNHPTNVHLSVHRAISVRDALVNANIDAVRIQVAGYGEHRPAVPNRTGGTPENRRVEIYLTPMPSDIGPTGQGGSAERGSGTSSSAGSARESSSPSRSPAPEPMK